MSEAIEVRSKLNKALTEINEKLSNLQVISTTPFKTNGKFKWNPNAGGGEIDILTCTKMEDLIAIHQTLKMRAEGYDKSASDLGIAQYPVFKWCGHTWKDWEHDLKLRVAVVNQHQIETRLKEAKEKLSRFLTEEDQLNNVLTELGF